MSSNVRKLRNIFVKKMIVSLVSQMLILGLLIIFVISYFKQSNLDTISENLLVKDQYTLDQIGSYKLLGSPYALDIELHNIGDMRKLDSVEFVTKIERGDFSDCTMSNDENFKLCKNSEHDYLGISTVKSDKKILGYIVTKKKYATLFSSYLLYDVLAIFITIITIFIFNFGLLFFPLKRKIEANTKLLLNLISSQPDPDIILNQINIEEYKEIAKKFLEEKDEIKVLQKDKIYYQAREAIAEQVAHDIRSPLAALNILTNQDLPIPEQSKILLRNVISRIRDITNDLVEKNRDPYKAPVPQEVYSIQLLTAIIYPVVTEKRLEIQSNSQVIIEFQTSEENYGLFAKINTGEFKRLLSNIINNAIEAIVGKGKVLIQMTHDNENIHLMISDDGVGIPPDILKSIGKNRVSYNKASGTGLGLYHANNTMEKCGGKLELLSKIDKGTRVTLTFPRAATPSWFFPKLEIVRDTTLVILDDDLAIHQLWQNRFEPYEASIRLINFNSPDKFREWIAHSKEKSSPILYFFDLEYPGYFQTGLSLIEDYQLHENSVLITSHFEESDIREHCEKLRIKMIPKDLAVFIPIMIVSNITSF